MHGLHPTLRAFRFLNLLAAFALLPFGAKAGVSIDQPVIIVAPSAVHIPLSTEWEGCQPPQPELVNSEFENQVVALVNQTREAASLPPLKRVANLDYAARAHGLDMAQDGYFNHDTYDLIGADLQWVCSWFTRVAARYAAWNYLAENIAWGYPTPESVMAGWMNSSGHAANIISPDVWEIGVGFAQGNYWVQDFGRRSGIYPLVLNNDAPETASAQVSVYLYGNFTEMRLQNDSGAWSDWQPFQSQFTWQLPGGAGLHTVNAEMRSAHAYASSSDEITLTQSADVRLDDLPALLTFYYSLPDQRFFPPSYRLTPRDASSEQALEWEVASSGSWYKISPEYGVTPETIIITPLDSLPITTTLTYTGFVTVTVTSPYTVSPHMIHLSLEAIDRSIQSIYLPSIPVSSIPTTP